MIILKPNTYDMIDLEARNYFSKGIVLISIINCCFRFNHYVSRDRIINYGMAVEECPRCSQREDWYHVIQCFKTFELKVNFIIELQE